MKKVILAFCLLIIGLLVVGCGGSVESISIISDQVEFDESFTLSDMLVLVKKRNGSEERVALEESMIKPDDLALLNQPGTHTLNVTYLGEETTFTITITGEQGDPGTDGREVVLRINEGFIQWMYEGETSWNDLISTTALKGSAGTNGVDGKQIELQDNGLFIQWRYLGDSNWNNLISIDTIKGIDGEDGTNGKEIELQVTNEFIQWRYLGDTTWQNLIALSLVTGPQGEKGLDGNNGIDGKEVEFQTTSDYIQWRYLGDSEWINLIAQEAIKGQDGQMPLIEISVDGYWIINGVKTDSKANTIEYFTIEFIVDSFTNLDLKILENVEEGTFVNLPIPTKEGLLFDGWFTGLSVNSGKFTDSMPIASNLKLYPKFINNNPAQTLDDFYEALYGNYSSFSVITNELFFDYRTNQKVQAYEYSDYIYEYDYEYQYIYSVNPFRGEFFEGYQYYNDYDIEIDLFKDINDNIYNDFCFYEFYPYTDTYDYFINNAKPYKLGNQNKYNFVLENDIEIYYFVNEFIDVYDVVDINYLFQVDLDQLSISFYIEMFGVNGLYYLWENERVIFNLDEVEPVIKSDFTLGMLDYLLADNSYLEYIGESDKAKVMQAYNECRILLTETKDLYESYSIINYFINTVYNSEFVIDELQMAKDNSFQKITEEYEKSIQSAINIEALETLYQNYLTLLEEAENYNIANLLSYQFESELNNTIEFDNEKRILVDLQQNYLDFLEFYVQEFKGFGNIQEIYDDNKNLILETISYQGFIDAYKSVVGKLCAVPTDPKTLAFNENLKYILMNLYSYYDYYEDDEYLAKTLDICAQIDEANYLNEVYLAYITGIIDLDYASLNIKKANYLEIIEGSYVDYSSYLTPESLELFNIEYLKVKDYINSTIDSEGIYDAYWDFYSYGQSLTVDELKYNKFYKIKEIRSFAFDYTSEFTAESIQEVQINYQSYLDRINSCTTSEEVNLTVDAIYEEINGILVYDFTLITLDNHFKFLEELFTDAFYDLKNETVFLYWIQFIDSQYNSYEDLMLNFNKTVENVLALDNNISIKHIEEIKTNMINNVKYEYYNLYICDSAHPVLLEVKTLMEETEKTILTDKLLKNYIDCLFLLEEAMLPYAIVEAQAEIEEYYQQAIQFVYPESLEELNYAHQYYLDFASYAFNTYDASMYLGMFIDDVNYEIGINDLQKAKYDGICEINALYDEWVFVLIDENLVEMAAFRDYYIDQVNNCELTYDISQVVNEFNSEFMNVAETDSVKIQLAQIFLNYEKGLYFYKDYNHPVFAYLVDEYSKNLSLMTSETLIKEAYNKTLYVILDIALDAGVNVYELHANYLNICNADMVDFLEQFARLSIDDQNSLMEVKITCENALVNLENSYTLEDVAMNYNNFNSLINEAKLNVAKVYYSNQYEIKYNEVLATVIPEEYDLVVAAGVCYYAELDLLLTDWGVWDATNKNMAILSTFTVEPII